MKANELMIGVSVYFCCFDGSKIVVCVTGFKDGIVYGDSDKGSHWCNIEKVEPIPITPEILEKNGFVFNGYKYDLNVGHYEMWVIFGEPYSQGRHCLQIYNEYRYLPIKYHNLFKYVHELQHAMRLCGIKKEIIL